MPDASDEEEMPVKGVTLGHRVGLVERDLRSHSRSITVIIDNYAGLHARLTALEEFKLERLVTEAREDERDKALDGRLTRMERSIEEGLKAVHVQVQGMRAVWQKVLIGASIPVLAAMMLGAAWLITVGAKIPPV